jgi:hypothetical protein
MGTVRQNVKTYSQKFVEKGAWVPKRIWNFVERKMKVACPLLNWGIFRLSRFSVFFMSEFFIRWKPLLDNGFIRVNAK